MGSTTILRGVRVSVKTLDAFLMANGLEDIDGPPFYKRHPDKDPISVLLYKKITEAGGTADKNNFRVIVPAREGCDESTVAYVTYTWVSVFAHIRLRLDEGQDLPKAIPTGFEELRKEILSHSSDGISIYDKVEDEGQIGLFAVFTQGIRGHYAPQVYFDQSESPQYCDQCDAVFENPEAWEQRQDHRMDVHGSTEGRDPLPEA